MSELIINAESSQIEELKDYILFLENKIIAINRYSEPCFKIICKKCGEPKRYPHWKFCPVCKLEFEEDLKE